MTDIPSRGIRLFGTDQPVAPPRLLRAGPLSAELEAGNLRYIRMGGVEVMRAISFIVRDKDWGTYDPEITGLEIEESPERFTVRYRARTADAEQAFSYEAEIVGDAGGRLTFSGRGSSEEGFLTNRTGFVILHPADVAGDWVEIAHVDGRVVESRFPALIDPVQPMMDLRRLTHRAAGGALTVACLMEGDTFEMEDQRNWTDASYKTYVRPLALPWPYRLEPGEVIDQTITLTVAGAVAEGAGASAVRVTLGGTGGQTGGVVPALGLGLDPADTEAAGARIEAVRGIGADHLICHHDVRRGHDAASLGAQAALARELGATPWLEAVVTSVEGFEDEIAGLGRIAADLGDPFAVVMVSPAPDMKCTLPGSPWPPAPPAEAMFDAARRAFPQARIGGGMFSYFTELNRKRPPVDRLDLVSFTTSALVHAGDDRSAVETLQALPAIAASVAEIAGGRPWAVGPSAIGMRDNPYGAATKENPGNIRQAMNLNDPRQRGLLGAAWALGYFARFAEGGAEAVALGGPVGAFGAVHAPANFPQPWFDEAGGGLFPVWHVLRGLARLKGAARVPVTVSRPDTVLGIAARTGAGTEIWLANLTGSPVEVAVDADISAAASLDEDGFPAASRTPGFLDTPAPASGGTVTLGAYGVLRAIAAPTN